MLFHWSYDWQRKQAYYMKIDHWLLWTLPFLSPQSWAQSVAKLPCGESAKQPWLYLTVCCECLVKFHDARHAPCWWRVVQLALWVVDGGRPCSLHKPCGKCRLAKYMGSLARAAIGWLLDEPSWRQCGGGHILKHANLSQGCTPPPPPPTLSEAWR